MNDARADLLSALDALFIAITRNAEADRVILVRVEELKKRLLAGDRLDTIVTDADGPLIVRLTRENLERLYDAGSAMRRAEARALHDEGMSMDRIATLFGVTRQRVSALLRNQNHKSRPNTS
jgi:predicted XRE-type DNA-binding protein